MLKTFLVLASAIRVRLKTIAVGSHFRQFSRFMNDIYFKTASAIYIVNDEYLSKSRCRTF